MDVELHERVATGDGVEIAWQAWGEGEPALALCHGFSGNAHDFSSVVPALAERRRVVAMDHRGHGRSTKLGRLEGYALDVLAEDVVRVLDAAGGPVHLLGHSMGGRLVLRVALERPDLVASLILMDTSAWGFVDEASPTGQVVADFMATFDPTRGLPDLSSMRGPEDDAIEATMPADLLARRLELQAGFDPYAMAALGRELFGTGVSVKDQLGELKATTTVIVGEHDHPFVDQAAELASLVPDGQVELIEGAWHSPQLTHPASWLAAVERHLSRVG
jgi:pimeloyl-ACP methyl ester carboxylesterase